MAVPNWMRRWVAKRDRRAAARLEAGQLRAYLATTAPSRNHGQTAAAVGADGLPPVELADRAFAIGTEVGDPQRLVTVQRSDIVKSHLVCYGATGVGKTVAMLLLYDQELRRLIARLEQGLEPDCAILLLEPKHDLAPSFLRLLEARLAETTGPIRERVLSQLTTFNPFGRYVVPLPLLNPEQGVSPELHAMSLSGLIGRLSGSAFGPKQRPILDVILLAFIMEGIALPLGVELVGNWERLRALGRQSRSPMVRGFFDENARMPAGSLDGIRARLLRLVFAPNLREMFSATQGLDFDSMLKPGSIGVLDVGGDQGDEDLTAFFCGFFLLKLGRAVRRRPNGATPALLLIDEFQRVLQGDGDVADQSTTFLETARSRGVAVHLLTQSPASVSAVSPRLLRAIHTNAALEILGATDDPSALAGILPVTGRHPRPTPAPWEQSPNSPWLSREEELRLLIEQTQALPPRQFWVRAKRRSPKAVLTRTLDFAVPPSRGGELASRIERGRWGYLPREVTPVGQGPRVVLLGNRPAPHRPRGL